MLLKHGPTHITLVFSLSARDSNDSDRRATRKYPLRILPPRVLPSSVCRRYRRAVRENPCALNNILIAATAFDLLSRLFPLVPTNNAGSPTFLSWCDVLFRSCRLMPQDSLSFPRRQPRKFPFVPTFRLSCKIIPLLLSLRV